MKAGKQKRRGPLLSIDLGSHSIKFAQGQLVGEHLKVTALFTEEIPEDVYSNGNIKDLLALKTAIQSAVKQNRISVKDVVVSIECTEIIKREMVIPRVPDEDRFDLIAYEVSQYLPIDVNSYVLQYKLIEEVIEDGAVKDRILLGAIPKDIVKPHFDLLIDCGLNPVFMDMHSNSLEKLIKICPPIGIEAQDQTTAYIDFGNKIIDISIFENHNYKFNRLLKLGSSEFDRILMNYLEVDHKEAENRKKKTSVMNLRKLHQVGKTSMQDEASDGEKISEKDSEVKRLVIKEISSYLDESVTEIGKVFKYYTSRNSENKIDQLLIYGGGSQFQDLVELFHERLEIPCLIVTRFNNLDLATKNNADELPKYVNALGALIRS